MGCPDPLCAACESDRIRNVESHHRLTSTLSEARMRILFRYAHMLENPKDKEGHWIGVLKINELVWLHNQMGPEAFWFSGKPSVQHGRNRPKLHWRPRPGHGWIPCWVPLLEGPGYEMRDPR